MLGARRSEVLGLNGADEPAHEFDPGHRFGTTDCDPLRRSTRGRNCFFRRPDRRDLDQEAGRWKYFTREAIGHSLLISGYHLLRKQCIYQDLGPDYLDRKNAERLKRYLVKRLESLGQKVTLEPRESAA